MHPERIIKSTRSSSFPSSKRQKDWEELYGEVKVEPTPPDAPIPCGKPVETAAWFDTDHAGHAGDRQTLDEVTHTGAIIFINSAPILWLIADS